MIKRLGKCVREYKKPAILTPIFVSLEVIMEVIMPLLMVELIDKGIEAGNMNEIVKIGMALVVIAILSLIFGVFRIMPVELSGLYSCPSLYSIPICKSVCIINPVLSPIL